MSWIFHAIACHVSKLYFAVAPVRRVCDQKAARPMVTAVTARRYNPKVMVNQKRKIPVRWALLGVLLGLIRSVGCKRPGVTRVRVRVRMGSSRGWFRPRTYGCRIVRAAKFPRCFLKPAHSTTSGIWCPPMA